jgi:tRNA1Val (adenine37-N6)-methyltransferase
MPCPVQGVPGIPDSFQLTRMPNTYFQFKQFIVHQEHAALKVSTDSCLFGAWCANRISESHLLPDRILDIGAGTGLLMLMLAQKTESLIDGIEIQEASFLQAQSNIRLSPWSDRLRLYKGDVKVFDFSCCYDFIISNPPFYEKDLRSEFESRNVAMHDAGLKVEDLLRVVDRHLSPEGRFAVLLPAHRVEMAIALAQQQGLWVEHRCDVKQTVSHSVFRSFLIFSRIQKHPIGEEISIRNHLGSYTEQFSDLLRDYYLYL